LQDSARSAQFDHKKCKQGKIKSTCKQIVRNGATTPDKTQAGMIYDWNDVRASDFVTLHKYKYRTDRSAGQDPINTP